MRDIFTRMEWDNIEYQINQDKYEKEHGICTERSGRMTRNSSTLSMITDELANSMFWTARPKEMKEGYVTERRAGKYIERRVRSQQVVGGSLIRKLPHETLWDGTVLKPYVRTKDIYLDDDGAECVAPSDVHFMKENTSRFANPRGVRRSCENFKWLIRANEPKIRLFVTLTYAKNMTDTRQLYQDYRNFWSRLKREYTDLTGYLVAFEPQKRGAWHAHMLLLSDNAFLFIPNKKMHALWGKGFTKTQTPKGKMDIASYLTSYLTNVKEGRVTKKGARLYMYKAGFHFLRHSKNVSYDSVNRWYGPFDKLNGVADFKLLYDYQNITRMRGPGLNYQVTKIVGIEVLGSVEWYPGPPPV